MKQNKVIDMGLIITETLADIAEKFPAKNATLSDVEKSFRDYEQEIGLKADVFVSRYAKKFLENCPFVERKDDGWRLIPQNLKAHKLAKEALEEGGNFILEQKLRSMVAKKMNQKVSDTKLYLEIDDDFSNLEILKSNPNSLTAERQVGRGKIWGLSNWWLINDEAIKIIESEGPAKEKKLLSRVVEKRLLSENLVPIFSPTIDKRFLSESGNLWDVVKPKKKSLDSPKTGRLEIKIREEITKKIERLLENQESKKSFSREEITTALIGSTKSSRSSHYGEMLDEILSDFEKGKLITKVRFEPTNPSWIKSESLPKINTKNVSLIFPLPYPETNLIGDDIFDESLYGNLSNPALYWLDGDFSEKGFPEVEPLLILTFNDFVTDEVNYVSQPLSNAIQASLLASQEWGEFTLETPNDQSLSILINFKNQTLSGMGDWINGNAQPGDVYAFEYLGSSKFRIVKTKEIKNPVLEDDELEQLLKLQEKKGLTVKDLIVEVLKNNPGGLTFSGIFGRIMFAQRVSRRALMSELTRFYCFDSKDEKWKYYPKREEFGEKFSTSSFPILGVETQCWVVREAMNPKKGDSLNLNNSSIKSNDLFAVVNEKTELTNVFRVNKKKGKFVVENSTNFEPISVKDFSFPQGKLKVVENSLFCDINELAEKKLLDSEVYAGIKKAFAEFEAEVSVNQEITKSLEDLEGLLEDSGSVSPFGGLAWQLQQNFNWKEFQKVLDAKIYSQEHESRLDAEKFSQWLTKRPISWDANSIVYPSGHGEITTAILEAIILIMKNADYVITDQSLNIRTSSGEDFVFEWSKLISDKKRIENIVNSEESFQLVEFLTGWFRRIVDVVEPRKLENIITKLSFSLKGVGSVDVDNRDLPEFIKGQKASLQTSLLGAEKHVRYASLFADFRGFSKAKIKKTLSLISSNISEGGLVVIVASEDQKIQLQDGVLEEQISMGSVVAKSYVF